MATTCRAGAAKARARAPQIKASGGTRATGKHRSRAKSEATGCSARGSTATELRFHGPRPRKSAISRCSTTKHFRKPGGVIRSRNVAGRLRFERRVEEIERRSRLRRGSSQGYHGRTTASSAQRVKSFPITFQTISYVFPTDRINSHSFVSNHRQCDARSYG